MGDLTGEDRFVADVVADMVERLLPILSEQGQQYYQQRIEAGRPIGRAQHDASEYLVRLIGEVSRDIQKRLDDHDVIPFAYPGIPWEIAEYRQLRKDDHDGMMKVQFVRDSLRDMKNRYTGDAADVFAIPAIRQPERVRLFVDGMSYGAIGKQMGVSGAAVQASVESAWYKLVGLGRS